VYAKTRVVWVRAKPTWSAPWLGYLAQGGSVATLDGAPIYAHGCDAWYAVVPRGYVCVDRKRATIDASDPELALFTKHAPDLSSPTPYRYAASLGAERYEAPPARDEQKARERDLAGHLGLLDAARRGEPLDSTLAGVDLSPAATAAVAFASLPVELQIKRRRLPPDSTVAFLGEYIHDDRTFLLTSDFAWVPKDRVRIYTPTAFHGVELGARVKLPLAFFRQKDRPAYEHTSGGDFVERGRGFSRLGWIALTQTSARHGDQTYLETAEAGVWIRESDCVVLRPAERTPWGSPVGASDPARPPGRATWVEASVRDGWLIAYEGTSAVFATLVATGRGGAFFPRGEEPILTSSTPIGRFSVTGKFVTATMDGGDGSTHADVPWVQNFRGAHAIHSAYWHDAWGEAVSDGCLNVSPQDGRWLFDFSEPKVPDGWYGVRWDPRAGPGASASATTTVLIHR
jgi:hypothetical protein